jgi:hypothetical protein
MRVELNVPESVTEPRMLVQHQPVLVMALRTGSIEIGLRRSEMMKLTFGVGEMCLLPRHFETWVRTDDLHYLYLSVGISDAALAAACDGTRGDVGLAIYVQKFQTSPEPLATFMVAVDRWSDGTSAPIHDH